MSGEFWTTEELNDLLTAWKNRRADTTVKEFAADYAHGIRTPAAVSQKLLSMPDRFTPPSTRTPWNTPPRLTGDTFVLMDAQIPFHHAEFIDRCLTVCKRHNIRQMVLGGDAIDLNIFNEFAPNFENDDKRVIDSKSATALLDFAKTLPSEKREVLENMIGEAERENGVSGEIKESRQVLHSLETHFDNILWIMGNHEQRILRILKKILPVSTLATLFGADNPKWTVSPYYYCELESGGEEWRIEHPVNSGKGSSKKLAQKFGKHIVMGHNHHFSITTEASGKYFAIEPGMGMDESRMAYSSQRSNSADTHVVGALIIHNGKPTPLNRFTDWELLA